MTTTPMKMRTRIMGNTEMVPEISGAAPQTPLATSKISEVWRPCLQRGPRAEPLALTKETHP